MRYFEHDRKRRSCQGLELPLFTESPTKDFLGSYVSVVLYSQKLEASEGCEVPNREIQKV